jgi:hypothetical protein
MALNCKDAPGPVTKFAGARLIEVSVDEVTVTAVDPATLPDVALIVVVPIPTLFARPLKLTMVATAVLRDLHVTEEVRSCVLPSLYVPVAANWIELPKATEGLTGVTEMESSVGNTVKVPPWAVTPPTVTEIGPVVAPVGTVTASAVAVAAVTLAATPLKRTVLLVGVGLKP